MSKPKKTKKSDPKPDNRITAEDYAAFERDNARIDAESAAVSEQAQAEQDRQDAADKLDVVQIAIAAGSDVTDEQLAAAMTELEQATPMSVGLEEVVAQLDAVDDAAASVLTVEAIAVHEAPAEAVHETPATGEPSEALELWNKAIGAIDQASAIQMALKVSAAIDDRMTFEAVKDAGNANIQRTLKKAAKLLSLPSACKAMDVTGFDLGQLNRTKHAGSRYNVYAFGKLADVLNGVVNGAINNSINNACLRSLLKCHKAGIAFTMETAKMAASDKIRVTDKNVAACLVRHTVSASTAPTQASSTMQALTDLGIVNRGGTEKNPIFSLTDAPVVAKLASILS